MANKSSLATLVVVGLALLLHTAALGATPGGPAWAWGLNSDGELGNGTVTPYSGVSSPVQVTGLTRVVAVAGGDQHSLGLMSDGTVWAWGNDGWGQLGNGQYAPSATPIQVPGLSGVTAIAAGSLHSLALKSDGSVWAWGFDYYGQVGNGTSGGNVLSPARVKGLGRVTDIAAGGFTSYALKSDGSVWAWGYDGQGELGNGIADEHAHSVPSKVRNLSTAVAIAGGAAHALAIVAGGKAVAWGDNQTSELGAATTATCSVYATPCSKVPVAVSVLTGVVSLAGGYGSSFAVKSDGTAWGWGQDGYGELGNGSAQLFCCVKSPVKAKVTGVRAVAAGASYTLWLASDGSVWAAGANDFGQLGNGTFKDSVVPVKVSLTGVTAIAAGHSHSLAVRGS